MGKVARFFGNPGKRPDIHQRAPIIIPEDTVADPASKIVHEKQDSVYSGDDSSQEFGTVSVAENGYIHTSRGFTGLERGLTDRVLDWLVKVAGSEYVFFHHVDYSNHLDCSGNCIQGNKRVASCYAGWTIYPMLFLGHAVG